MKSNSHIPSAYTSADKETILLDRSRSLSSTTFPIPATALEQFPSSFHLYRLSLPSNPLPLPVYAQKLTSSILQHQHEVRNETILVSYTLTRSTISPSPTDTKSDDYIIVPTRVSYSFGNATEGGAGSLSTFYTSVRCKLFRVDAQGDGQICYYAI